MNKTVTKTPLRISFAGGGTDYPDFYKYYGGGKVIGTSIFPYITVHLEKTDAQTIVVESGEFCQIANEVAEIANPIVQGVLREMKVGVGYRVKIESEVNPKGCGLGTSSALTLGLLRAFYELEGQKPPVPQLISQAYRVENERARVDCGLQDQYLCGHAGASHIYFKPNGDIILNEFAPFNASYWRAHLHLYKVSERSTKKPKMQTSLEKGIDVENLKILRSLVPFMCEALSKPDPKTVGHLLDESWALKRLRFDMSETSQIDDAYNDALTAGAYGGKLLGAGGGGYLLLCVRPDRLLAIDTAMKNAGAKAFPFHFIN